MIEAIALSIIGSMLFYIVKRVDNLSEKIDERLDMIDRQIVEMQMSCNLKRRNSQNYYSENSGIEM